MTANRLLLVRNHYRRVCHWAGRIAHRFSSNRFVGLFFPSAATFYFVMLDVWGEKWAWIANHQNLHEWIFLSLAGVALLALFIQSLSTKAKIEGDGEANVLLNSFIAAVGVIVNIKTNRFRRSLSQLRKNADKFRVVAAADDQIGAVATATAGFVCNAFGIPQDGFDITIARSKAGSPAWHYIFELQRWKHTDPNDLLGQPSAASASLQAGEPLFFPDKFARVHGNRCTPSARDLRRGAGSMFVYPAVFDTPKGTERYIISFVTYGTQLCDEWDEVSVRVTECFLREFCRRLELELCLYALKFS
jgi:hypothetical protein